MLRVWIAGFAFAASLGAASAASAAVIFSENFNSYTGTSVGQQPGTGLNVYTNGSVPNWNYATGNGAINGLDRGAGNYAIMFYDGNLMYNRQGIAANDLGVSYTIAFTGSETTSSNAAQVTQAGDFVRFIVNDAGGTVTSYDYAPDLTTTAFLPYSFTYTGTGRGNIFLVIKDGIDNNGTYGGAIDDVTISTTPALAQAVPEPASMALLGAGLLGLGLIRRRA